MSAYYTKMTMPSASLGGTNPLPVFRAEDIDSHPKYDSSFTPDEAATFGKNCGRRVLPYLTQDRYDRDIKPVEQPVIVLENEHLRAVILCNYGGRLYGLYDKDAARDLLFQNPVIQPANLAIRDAWLSGGIEWNIGQVGHTFTTCSPMFCAILNDGEGNDFARIYEYERQKRLFWQVDMHLPKGSRELIAYVRIVNPSNEPTPMYWWTTTAVAEDETTRVFASARRAMYSDPSDGLMKMKDMPYFPTISDKDLSYTLNLPKSNDFFLQTPADVRSPWEAAAYGNGAVTFERSTSLLHYRKVFCWGDLAGGRRWKEFLSTPGGGSYIEIQAGIGQSQTHGLTMPANTTWDFTMAMGGLFTDPDDVMGENWESCREKVGGLVSNRVSEDEIYALHAKCARCGVMRPENIVHYGSGWGALESMRRIIPDGFRFPQDSMGAEQAPWLRLLSDGTFPVDAPVSYMTDPDWRRLLENAPDSWAKYYQLGVSAAEIPDRKTAEAYFKRSIELDGGFWPTRAMAFLLAEDKDRLSEASDYYRKAAGYPADDIGFPIEYLRFLAGTKAYSDAVAYYDALPSAIRANTRVKLITAECELALGQSRICDEGLFELSFPTIREGEVSLTDMWFRYEALKLSRESGEQYGPELIDKVRRTMTPPKAVDFRMVV